MKVLVVAKSPVPGLAKTRLAASVGDPAAADCAAAALLDTLDAAVAAVGAEHRDRVVVSFTGDLAAGARADDLRTALAGCTVVPQVGDGFAERLVRAHLDAGPGPVVQVGMDTPQATAEHLHAAAAGLEAADTVLGPADDGGWWVLARTDPAAAAPLAGVPMSTESTHDDTRDALVAAGFTVAATGPLLDVDTAADADLVAAAAPGTRFAAAWATCRRGVVS
ncbi:MAG: glycosyltransferase [Nocardioides sp.]|nr:glycosyltransferase [Nocardioides sp.]